MSTRLGWSDFVQLLTDQSRVYLPSGDRPYHRVDVVAEWTTLQGLLSSDGGREDV